MHRSGTSTVTRVLNILGAKLPKRLMPPAQANEAGFFEPDEIVRIHDRFLKRIGSSWHDHRPLPDIDAVERSRLASELVDALAVDYDSAPLCVIKDPRICRLLPIWKSVLARAGLSACAVLVHRSAREVAASIEARDRIPREHGLLLWLRHVLDAESETRDMPRFFLRYDEMLGRDFAWVERMQTFLPLAWPRLASDAASEIGSFVDPALRHQTSRQWSAAPRWISAVETAYEALELDPADVSAMATLDAVRGELNEATSLFLGASAGMRTTRLARLRGSLANAVDARMARLRQGRRTS
jgi:hypothetical protein